MRIGNLLIWAGIGLVLIGVLVRFVPGALSWFGHLPGDIEFRWENSRVSVPITSMIVLSVVITVVANLIALILRSR